MGALEPWHLIVILGIALIVFGPGKIGELGGTLGKAVRDFRDVSEGKTPIEPPQTCVNCRAAIPAGAKFCPGCGLSAATVTMSSPK
jgi:sec-independent protein translocase protein TatA